MRYRNLTSYNQTIISHEQLAKISGKAGFQQGLDESKKLSIEHFYADAKGASALVDGFRVNIHYASERVEGSCNCDQSDGFDFCLHCVCLTLYANKMAQQIIALSKGPDKSRVLAYLLSQDKQTLAKQCLALIESDPNQFERYLLRASLTNNNINYNLLKTQITEMTKKQENLFSQRQVKHFFSKIDRFLKELNLINVDHEPDKLLKVIEHTVLRINRLLTAIDDASGQRNECIKTLRQLYSKLISSLAVRAENKAKRYYTLWMADRFDLLDSQYNGFLTPVCSQKFIALVHQAWKNHSNSSKKIVAKWQQNKIARFLLERALEENDQAKISQFREAIEHA